MNRFAQGLIPVALVVCAAWSAAAGEPGGAAASAESGPVRVGLIKSLFRGQEPSAIPAQVGPFNELLTIQAGVRTSLDVVDDPLEMARKIQTGELHLGILHGIEYAWVKEQFPEIRPLVLACNQRIRLVGYLVVRSDNDAKSVADLKGKTLAMPRRSLNHCHLYLHRAIRDAGHDPDGFFAPTGPSANPDTALDDVVDGKAAVAVVDGLAFDVYRQRKPGRTAKLRILQESTTFPTATFLYKPGGEVDGMARKFRQNLLAAADRPIGRQLLTFWRLSGFVPVPQEYSQMLSDVLKDYPEPFQPVCFTSTSAAEKPVGMK